MKKLLQSLGLSIIACTLAYYLIPVGLLVGIIYIILTFNNKQGLEYAQKLFHSINIAIDQLGNVVCQHLFNLTLIKKEGHLFGNEDETISSVLGKNIQANTLSSVGRLLNFLLNIFEKDHSIKSIDK